MSFFSRRACIGILFLSLLETSFASAAIYQWEWVDASNHLLGKQVSGTLCTNGGSVTAESGAVLSNLNLSYAYLVGADLSNASINGCNFDVALFSNAIWTNSSVHQSSFNNADFTGAVFTKAVFFQDSFTAACFNGADFSGVTLQECKLSGANFTDAVIKDTGFVDCNLSLAQLYQTANYKDKNLRDVAFYGINLEGADFSGVDLTNVGFLLLNSKTSVKNANFTDAVISGASFNNCGLTVAQLCSTANYKNKNLQNSSFYDIDLTGISFKGMDLSKATLETCALTGVDFTDAIIDGSQLWQTVSLQQLAQTANYKNKNLNSVWLCYLDLTGGDFSGFDLSYVFLNGATLTNARLKSANFERAWINGATMISADFSGADLNEASFYLSDLSKANFSGARFINTEMWSSDLSGADFTGAQFKSAMMRGCIFSEAKFHNNLFSNSPFDGCRFDNAVFTGANLQNMKAYYCSFNQANCSLADFQNAYLINCRFQNADLTSANFSGAEIDGIDLRGATGANLTGANAANVIKSDGTMDGLWLTDSRTLQITNYNGNASLSRAPLGVHVKKSMYMDQSATLSFLFDEEEGNSVVSFDPGVSVTLDGKLKLSCVSNSLSQLGNTYKIFDWNGVAPTGSFTISNESDAWDTSKLYSAGTVTYRYAYNCTWAQWTGTNSGKWSDSANWSCPGPLNGQIIEFNELSTGHQPSLQNLSKTLDLGGIFFSPESSEQVLGGGKIALFGNLPLIVNASSCDQYINNNMSLDADTLVAVTGSGVLYLGGEIDGIGGLKKQGDGTVVLANTASYTGETTILGGVLALDASGDILHSPIVNQATFEILAGDHVVTSLAGAGDVLIDAGAFLTITGDSNSGAIQVGDGGGIIFGTPLDDSSSDDGGGVLILAAPYSTDTSAPAPVPEPATWMLLAMAVLGWTFRRKI